MSKPRRGTEAVFYDAFADWDADDQASALKVLEALHRQKLREERRQPLTAVWPKEDDESDNREHA